MSFSVSVFPKYQHDKSNYLPLHLKGKRELVLLERITEILLSFNIIFGMVCAYV
jgi:hypothetical protein